MTRGNSGKFITFEGGDGVGKTTQIRLIYDWIAGTGARVLLTREPGGTKIGEMIRAILLDPSNAEMSDMTEALLYAAARAQLAREVIRPALADGVTVICDRWLDSSAVYQGAAKALGDAVYEINAYATDGLEPDKTILLDLDVSAAFARGRADDCGDAKADSARGQDRIEALGVAWHEKVRAAYLELAARFPKRICVVDASDSPDVVHANIRTALGDVLSGGSL